MENSMFCFQCQETAHGTGCTLRGICGKDSETANTMDLLLFVVKGISIVHNELRKHLIKGDQQVNKFVIDALFSTITNANFDRQSLINRIEKGLQIKRRLISLSIEKRVDLPEIEEVYWEGTTDTFFLKEKEAGILNEKNEDIRSLKELIIYGIKGMAAYLAHTIRLGFDDESIHRFIQETLADITVRKLPVEMLTALVIQTGEFGVKGMALLDKANTERFGHPEITEVNLGVRKNPGILISGHDLKDMEELLEQTEGSGIDIYTHGEMLPAHYYPAFKKFKHFAGNYGNAWWRQREEFESFRGPILFTTNCIVPPLASASYKERTFTTNTSGYPGCNHIETDENGHKDFSEIIRKARTCSAPLEIEKGTITGGFAHHQVLQVADKIVEAVKNGSIRKFVVMAGCDGRMSNRNYYAEFAQALPKDTIILTAGCAKYRYNKLQLGEINGIPRVLDAGQCNDSYSLAIIALKLKEIFKLQDINELPIVYNIAWYEQKAVIVLLALLSLGVKKIHIGPTLPAFLSPRITRTLTDTFGIGSITTVDKDIENMIYS